MTPANGSAPAMDRGSATKEASSLSILAHAFVHENPYTKTSAERSRRDSAGLLDALRDNLRELADQLQDPGEPHGWHAPPKVLFVKTDEPLSEDDAEHLVACFLDSLIGGLEHFDNLAAKFREYLQTEHDHNRVMNEGGEW